MLLLAAALFCACSDDSPEEVKPPEPDKPAKEWV